MQETCSWRIHVDWWQASYSGQRRVSTVWTAVGGEVWTILRMGKYNGAFWGARDVTDRQRKRF